MQPSFSRILELGSFVSIKVNYVAKEFCYNSDIFRNTLRRGAWITFMKIQTTRIALSAPAQLHCGLRPRHLAI
jgi:hypothetical protein